MNRKSHLYAFYGSLRRGMRLHKQFEEHLNYCYSVWLTGYKMYSLGNYPFIIKSGNLADKILVEVTRINDQEVAENINAIELDAGYECEEVTIGAEKALLFFFREATNNIHIKSGDWVTFFRNGNTYQ